MATTVKDRERTNTARFEYTSLRVQFHMCASVCVWMSLMNIYVHSFAAWYGVYIYTLWYTIDFSSLLEKENIWTTTKKTKRENHLWQWQRQKQHQLFFVCIRFFVQSARLIIIYHGTCTAHFIWFGWAHSWRIHTYS